MAAIQQILLSYGASPKVFSTWNPADCSPNVVLSNGNLTENTNANPGASVRSTLNKSSGKWYWEIFTNTGSSTYSNGLGNSSFLLSNVPGDDNNSIGYRASGLILKNGAVLATVSAYTSLSTIGIAYDATNGTVSFYLNNVLQYTASGTNVPTGPLYAAAGCYVGPGLGGTANFGATTLTYTPPAGFNSGLYQ